MAAGARLVSISTGMPTSSPGSGLLAAPSRRWGPSAMARTRAQERAVAIAITREYAPDGEAMLAALLRVLQTPASAPPVDPRVATTEDTSREAAS